MTAAAPDPVARFLDAMPICVTRFLSSAPDATRPDAVAGLPDLGWFFEWLVEQRLTAAPVPRLIAAFELARLGDDPIRRYCEHAVRQTWRFPDREAIERHLARLSAFLLWLASEKHLTDPSEMARRWAETPRSRGPLKLGVCYIVFDGVELLEWTIAQLRPVADFLQVIWQDVSWFGHPVKAEDLATLKRLHAEGRIDALTRFPRFEVLKDRSPASIGRSKTYELLKRQLGLLTSLSEGCTHYLCLDVDEFYVEAELRAAWKEIRQDGHPLTSVRYINYVRTPMLSRGLAEGCHVPFICEIHDDTLMGGPYPVEVDPTRSVFNGRAGHHVFPPEIVTMHHMETVRRDLSLKYAATTRQIMDRSRLDALLDIVRHADERTVDFSLDGIIPGPTTHRLTLVENRFRIPPDAWG